MRLVKANQATASKRRVYFHMVDGVDGITAETGESGGQPQVSTNGGAWTDTGISVVTSIGFGRYYADLTQAAVATAGDVVETRYKSSATAESPGDSVQVVAFDPDDATALGLSALTGGAAPTAAAVATAVWQDLLAGSDFSTSASVGKLLKDNVNATIGSRSTYDGSDTAGTATILSRVTGAVVLAGSAPGWYTDPVDVSADVSAIKAKTDNLPAAPAATGDIPTLTQILTTTMTEAYAAAGAGFSLAQALYEISANVSEVAFSGAAGTFYKRDHTTPAGTITLDDATTPTLRKRAT